MSFGVIRRLGISPAKNLVWMGLCSIHGSYAVPGCLPCRHGWWTTELERDADHDLYRENFEVWYLGNNGTEPDAKAWAAWTEVTGKPAS